MHWLMSFVGAVGKLMKNSVLDLLMKSAFAGVEKMLIGKKFPMNVRALRIVVIELLRSIMNNHTTEDQFYSTLNNLARKSKLTKHWIQNLIEPVFLMMMYVRAERESDIGLHLQKNDPIFLRCWPLELCQRQFGVHQINGEAIQ